VWEFNFRELSNTEQNAHDGGISLAGLQQNECRDHNVPHSWETIEPDILSLLISTGKPQSARHQNQTGYRHGETRLNHFHTNKENCWHNDARHVIDDEVEDMAVDMRGMEADVELAGDWAIDTIENLTHNEPYQGRANVAINDRLQGNQTR
jgi:hypothetical protein